MYMHSVPFFDTNSTIMSLWWLGWPVFRVFRIYTYIYMHSVLFCDVNSIIMFLWWLDWPVFGNFKNLHMCIMYIVLQCEFNCNYHGCRAVLKMTCFSFITTEHKWDVYMFLFASVYIYSWFFPMVCCLLQWM